MAYFPELSDAADWLVANVQNDGGWGMTAGQASSLVNTSEALFVIEKAGRPASTTSAALRFLRDNLFEHLESRGRRTRYAALPGAVLSECFPTWQPAFQARIAKWLISARNDDGGWGNDANDGRSDVFSTYLAVEALWRSNLYSAELRGAAQWTLAQFQDTGWPLFVGQGVSTSGSAYAIQILHRAAVGIESPAYKNAVNHLLATTTWANEELVIPGTKWLHSRAAAVVRALVLAGIDPFHPAIAEGTRHFQRSIRRGEGWAESPSDNAPTIRSQYWAVSALDPLWRALDPGIFVPRVEAERKQDTLLEPQYLPVFVGTPFHTIVPSGAFRALVWTMLGIGSAASLGLLDNIRFPTRSTAFLGVALILISAVAVAKRPKQFPRLGKIIRFLAIGLTLLGVAYGFDLLDVVSWAGTGLERAQSLLDAYHPQTK